jgi:hypothetical protein
VITAGHCLTGSGLLALWSHGGVAIGHAAVDAFREGSGADAGAIEVDSGVAGNATFVAETGDVRDLVGWLPDSRQAIWTEVCRSGATSGWTCGHIVANDVDATIDGRLIHHVWWTDFPSAHGDSGALLVDPCGHLLGIAIATTATGTAYSTVDGIAAELDVWPCTGSRCGQGPAGAARLP